MSEQTLWKKQHPAFPRQALPAITFESSLSLHLNDEDVRIIHFPGGHTDGDTIVFFPKSKVAALGDLYFSGMYPIFHPEHGGSLDGVIRNLTEILKILPQGTKLVPGHGPLSDKAELKTYLQMIQESRDTVHAGIKKSLDLRQIQKIGLPRKWDSYSHGFRTTDQWIEAIYLETI